MGAYQNGSVSTLLDDLQLKPFAEWKLREDIVHGLEYNQG